MRITKRVVNIILFLATINGSDAASIRKGSLTDESMADNNQNFTHVSQYTRDSAKESFVVDVGHRAVRSKPVVFYGRVWYDDIENNRIEVGEVGASDVRVSLFRKRTSGDNTENTFVKRTTVNSNGEWEIRLYRVNESSKYYLKFVLRKTPYCVSEPFVIGGDSDINNRRQGFSKALSVRYGSRYQVNAGLVRRCRPPKGSFSELDDVYLLIGQSNMVGRAPMDPVLDTGPIPNTWLLRNATYDWVPAKNPLNVYSTYSKSSEERLGIGPGYEFALRMQEVLPGQVGLVVQAVGATSILQWKKGRRLYENAVQKARAAMEFGTLRAVLWHQGESDRRQRDVYLRNLAAMIANLREDLGISNLPFVAGQLLSVTDKYSYYNDMIVDLPNQVPHTAVVLTDATLGTDDGSHFNRNGQLELGRRYAEAVFPFLQKG